MSTEVKRYHEMLLFIEIWTRGVLFQLSIVCYYFVRVIEKSNPCFLFAVENKTFPGNQKCEMHVFSMCASQATT